MVFLAHIEKFVGDFPHVFGDGRGQRILEQARALGHDPIWSGEVPNFMTTGDAAALFHLVMTDIRYVEITFKGILAQQKRKYPWLSA